MKAFRVKYNTPVYRVFSELVLVPDEADIPNHLATVSDKDFILNAPGCCILDTTEISIEDLPIRDLTIGQLYALIDHRICQNKNPTKSEYI